MRQGAMALSLLDGMFGTYVGCDVVLYENFPGRPLHLFSPERS